MGFPIRKSLDQSPFAAPQGLSQRTTSFIASQHQGIHRIPLLHLIDPIIHAGSLEERAQPVRYTHTTPGPRRSGMALAGLAPGLKTSLLQLYPQDCLPRAEAKGQSTMSAVKHNKHSIRIGAPETKPKPVPHTPIPNLAVLADNQPDRVSLHDVKSRSMRSTEQHQATAVPSGTFGSAKLAGASTQTGEALLS